jgi:hypothetical protein
VLESWFAFGGAGVSPLKKLSRAHATRYISDGWGAPGTTKTAAREKATSKGTEGNGGMRDTPDARYRGRPDVKLTIPKSEVLDGLQHLGNERDPRAN